MGRVMSYKIFSSELSDSFYKRKQHLLKEIAAKQRSGIFFCEFEILQIKEREFTKRFEEIKIEFLYFIMNTLDVFF